VTTLEEILDSVERKHGQLDRVWVFDRGIVSEENLNLLRARGASYLISTPRRQLAKFQTELIAEDWTQVAAHPQIQVKRIERWPYLKRIELTDSELVWRWDRKKSAVPGCIRVLICCAPI
jgi:hypothetical protein